MNSKRYSNRVGRTRTDSTTITDVGNLVSNEMWSERYGARVEKIKEPTLNLNDWKLIFEPGRASPAHCL